MSAAFVLANQGVGRRITNDITSYYYENIKNNIHYPISKTKSKGRKIKRSRNIYARQHYVTPPHPDNMDNNDDTIIDFLVKSLKSVENGIIMIDMRNEPAMQINATTKKQDRY